MLKMVGVGKIQSEVRVFPRTHAFVATRKIELCRSVGFLVGSGAILGVTVRLGWVRRFMGE